MRCSSCSRWLPSPADRVRQRAMGVDADPRRPVYDPHRWPRTSPRARRSRYQRAVIAGEFEARRPPCSLPAGAHRVERLMLVAPAFGPIRTRIGKGCTRGGEIGGGDGAFLTNSQSVPHAHRARRRPGPRPADARSHDGASLATACPGGIALDVGARPLRPRRGASAYGVSRLERRFDASDCARAAARGEHAGGHIRGAAGLDGRLPGSGHRGPSSSPLAFR